MLVHDGYGIWLANRRLNQGRFCWRHGNTRVELTRPQFDALVLGLLFDEVLPNIDPGSRIRCRKAAYSLIPC